MKLVVNKDPRPMGFDVVRITQDWIRDHQTPKRILVVMLLRAQVRFDVQMLQKGVSFKQESDDITSSFQFDHSEFAGAYML